MSSIVENAMDALQSGHKVQSKVREFIATSRNSPEHTARILATDMGVFRQEAEGWIRTAPDETAVKDRRKKANNIINDVSRICRDTTGFTIKCTSRKNHTYEAAEPSPRATPTPATPVAPDDAQLKDACEKMPATVIDHLLDMHAHARIGKMVASAIRERRENA